MQVFEKTYKLYVAHARALPISIHLSILDKCIEFIDHVDKFTFYDKSGKAISVNQSEGKKWVGFEEFLILVSVARI